MSAIEHKDRYRFADGTVVEKMAPKYFCFQKSQKLRDCQGQQLYNAEIVDGIVLQIAYELFQQIKRQPRDHTTEQTIRKELIVDTQAGRSTPHERMCSCSFVKKKVLIICML